MQKIAERQTLRRTNSSTGRGPGRPPVNDMPDELVTEDDSQRSNQIQRRGATLALTSIARYMEADLPTKIPRLWDLILGELTKSVDSTSSGKHF